MSLCYSLSISLRRLILEHALVALQAEGPLALEGKNEQYQTGGG